MESSIADTARQLNQLYNLLERYERSRTLDLEQLKRKVIIAEIAKLEASL